MKVRLNACLNIHHGIALLAMAAALLSPVAGFAQGMGGMGGDSSMQNMQKGGVVPPAQVLTKLWKQESGEFIALAEAMPADKFNFAPDDKMGKFDGVRTWAQEVKHVTEVNYGLLRGFNLPGAMSRPEVEKLQTRDEISSALKDSYAYLQKGIETVTPQNAFEDMDGKGDTRFGMIAYALIHNNDHLGQMVEYLRMNGIIPPESKPQGK